MKDVYAYIRVSTTKQGEKGASLPEQQDAITAYAHRHDLRVVASFVEMETASKSGRREFTKMLALLKKGGAQGVIIHKVDRGARNLRDWSDIKDLVAENIDVYLAHENLDLSTRSGSLSADILAVIAADFSRNLRDEVCKGLYGRLKQGLYPFQAKIGYLDCGKGAVKQIDPIRAPFIRRAFELYATGKWNLKHLCNELYSLGLRSRSGKKVSLKRLSVILNDPFYMGIIEIKRNGQLFEGAHEPLISKALFDQVQAVLAGRTNARGYKHSFLFRRMIKCVHCGYSLIGERQKGHIYYRCQTATCPTTCLREEAIDECVRDTLVQALLSERDYRDLRKLARAYEAEWETKRKELRASLALRLSNVTGRLSRLTDAFIDGEIERPVFDDKQRSLMLERKEVQEQMATLDQKELSMPEKVMQHLELSQVLPLSYEMAKAEEKRDIVAKLTSNLSADGKSVAVRLRSPFQEIGMLRQLQDGAPSRNVPRTKKPELRRLFDHIVADFCELPSDTPDMKGSLRPAA